MSDENRRLVEAGRVCLVNYGPLVGKLVVIVTIVDGKVALVDGPSATNPVKRQLMPLKRLSITPIKCSIPAGARVKTLEKAYKDAEVEKKWAESSWAKTIARKAAKAKLSDFDRFKVMVARKTRARVVNKAIKAMKK
ncbi:large subunit ribosomal protein L14e, cytoplasmic [Guillardia theta CCMP2712]|uniref:Large subunit ribosomal protein L14e, cytoplasmic n=1 Tax=Guillardia theta (strain CCMP2712) TaxID=905079 RepID=L1JWX7_GUITC|nr:large subunit ribosomal protein L14e, cytoplasmic [Guillardia theta CCMP2712]EKX52819.1 large subunit ribosomal protein L14e, cytoplasmic [Guillardia theta CCMP2712]|mmetsp:Transcript_48130/g.151022  ORF Transcript_48130/g.151022 Transcript_48130/m.151022 type:complete len:137 (-) Transcript_48130:188-598(-)|eukprot:XP_005839799.1 large subunit ribosomal protein L14e, cytoplasmic [Guillardia theta CCMP2712]